MAVRETNNTDGGQVELRIEKWVYGGAALARLDGQIVLVPYVLPGETIRARLISRARGLLRAVPVEIISATPGRVIPPCPSFGRCGGCHYQHVGYEIQLAGKIEILRETFGRVGKIEAPVRIDSISAEPYGYRNRIQLHVEGPRAGYREAGSHRICPVEQCPIASPRLNRALRENIAGRRFARRIESLELFTNERDLQGPGSPAAIDYQVGPHAYRVSRGSFFQVNRHLLEPLVERVAEVAPGRLALDLYAGAGLFSLPLAERFDQVIAVEGGRSAHGDLLYNARRAGLPVRAEHAAVDAFLESFSDRPDLVVADPPRAGMGKRVVNGLLRLRPPRLVIVSCDPATLARDLSSLLAAGYQIERLTMADLFPQTYHIEAVVDLVL